MSFGKLIIAVRRSIVAVCLNKNLALILFRKSAGWLPSPQIGCIRNTNLPPCPFYGSVPGNTKQLNTISFQKTFHISPPGLNMMQFVHVFKRNFLNCFQSKILNKQMGLENKCYILMLQTGEMICKR